MNAKYVTVAIAALLVGGSAHAGDELLGSVSLKGVPKNTVVNVNPDAADLAYPPQVVEPARREAPKPSTPVAAPGLSPRAATPAQAAPSKVATSPAAPAAAPASAGKASPASSSPPGTAQKPAAPAAASVQPSKSREAAPTATAVKAAAAPNVSPAVSAGAPAPESVPAVRQAPAPAVVQASAPAASVPSPSRRLRVVLTEREIAFQRQEEDLIRQKRLATLQAEIAELNKKLSVSSAPEEVAAPAPMPMPMPMISQEFADQGPVQVISTWGGDGYARNADLMVEGKRRTVRAGEVLSNGWRVTEIARSAITIQRGREKKTVKVGAEQVRIIKIGKRQFAFDMTWTDTFGEDAREAVLAANGESSSSLYTIVEGLGGDEVLGYANAGDVTGNVYSYAHALVTAKRDADAIYAAPVGKDQIWFVAIVKGVVVAASDRTMDAFAAEDEIRAFLSSVDIPLFAAEGCLTDLAGFLKERDRTILTFDLEKIVAKTKVKALKRTAKTGNKLTGAAVLVAVLAAVGYGAWAMLLQKPTQDVDPAQIALDARSAYVAAAGAELSSMPGDAAWAVEAYDAAVLSFPSVIAGWVLDGVTCDPSSCMAAYSLDRAAGGYSLSVIYQRFRSLQVSLLQDKKSLNVVLPLNPKAAAPYTEQEIYGSAPAVADALDVIGALALRFSQVSVDGEIKSENLSEALSAPADAPPIHRDSLATKYEQAIDSVMLRSLSAFMADAGFVARKVSFSNGAGAINASWRIEWARVRGTEVKMGTELQKLSLVDGDSTCRELVKLGRITVEDAARAQQTAQKDGISTTEALLLSNIAKKADILEAAFASGALLEAKVLADLPEWNAVLNDAGQVFGRAGVRERELAYITNVRDGHKRVFVLTVGRVTDSLKMHTGSKIRSAGYKLGGLISVTTELVDLVYSRLDQIKSGGGVGRTDSELHAKFDSLGRTALELKASDIHISSTIDGADVSMRVHGDLEKIEDLSTEYVTQLVSSVYNTLVSGDSTKEGFNPAKNQDGSIDRVIDGKKVRFRYSGLPLSPNGFDVTLRVIPIDVEEGTSSLAELGYSPDQEETLSRMFNRSSGLILIAGVTGSGKSTTMANRLEHVATTRPGKKVRTVEEPVEYRMRGVYQTAVKRVPGLENPFLETLRQLLRSDPDMLGVGEIRDVLTAELVLHGVRSGHLVASTLHADGAAMCFERLIGMGVGRESLAQINLVAGLVYQKLVQVLCSNCSVEASAVAGSAISPQMTSMLKRVAKIQGGSLDGIFLRNPKGCEHCNNKGVIGRTVCAEILRPSPEMVAAVGAADSNALWRHWRKQIDANDPSNMTGRTAFEHAIYKMRAGIVSPESVEQEFHYLDEFMFSDEITLKPEEEPNLHAEAA